jgi:hypothetical protein
MARNWHWLQLRQAQPWLGAGRLGSAQTAKVANGPNMAASHSHARTERPRLAAIRTATIIDAAVIKTMTIAAIMLQAPS